MRTVLKLSREQQEFLAAKRFSVLATLYPDGRPHLTVMWYLLGGDRVRMTTTADRVKCENIKRDNRVSLCVEDGYDHVVLEGFCQVDGDPETARETMRLLVERYVPDQSEHEKWMERLTLQGRRVTLWLTPEDIHTHGDA